jgi:predicted ATPase
MVDSIHIKNFKSVVDLELDLGYFNVLIGENGCGKSNILEGIALGSSVGGNELEVDLLSRVGIRVVDSKFMLSGFDDHSNNSTIEIGYTENGQNRIQIIKPLGEYKKNWPVDHYGSDYVFDTIRKIFSILKTEESLETRKEKVYTLIELQIEDVDFVSELIDSYESTIKKTNDINLAQRLIYPALEVVLENKTFFHDETFDEFIIYSPEQSNLRKFVDSNQILPIGINGEGLFQYLKYLASNKKREKQLFEIIQNLALLDWYSDLYIPDGLLSNEYRLEIRDKYIKEALGTFDQRSTNEGFLYLLFYFTLFTSKETPAFFAIDNIDTALNPKLCSELIRQLAKLAKKHKKQVILTTHNPAVLDGLNLKDDGQRLFVVRRNEEGHTKAKRIEYKPERTMKLSEVWTKGFIGGLPDNF